MINGKEDKITISESDIKILDKDGINWRPFGFVSVLILVLCLCGCVFSIIRQGYFNNSDFEAGFFNDSWKVYLNGEEIGEGALDSVGIPRLLEKGDVITMENHLPDGVDASNFICITTYLSSVKVTVDDMEVYNYGSELIEGGYMAGSGVHYISMPPNDMDSDIQIIITASEDDAFTSIPEVKLIKAMFATSAIGNVNVPALFMGNFLVVFGGLIFIFGIAMTFMDKSVNVFVELSFVSFFGGFWILCTTHAIQLAFQDKYFTTVCEYLSLYFLSVPVILMLMRNRRSDRGWRRKVFVIALTVFGAFDILAVLLHFSNVAHLPAVLKLYHVLVLISVVPLIAASWAPLKGAKITQYIDTLSLISLIAVGFLECVNFIFQKYVFETESYWSASILPYGIFCFVSLSIISFTVDAYEGIRGMAERKLYQKMAYHDEMTGLYNRAYSVEYLESLNREEARIVALAVDLNDLKITNDTKGHIVGDDLITSFAGILKDTFGSIAKVMRMGGDEFLVVGDIEHKHDVEAGAESLIQKEKEASENKDYDMSAAFGMASSDEAGLNDIYDVCRAADDKMYAQKTKMKVARRLEKDKAYSDDNDG